MNIIFMGTMEFARTILAGLVENYNIQMVVTQPDRPFGRKKILKSSPVKEFAIEKGIPVFQPESIRKDHQPILDLHPDIILVCQYGQMIPSVLLDTPRFGCVNVHASLLPKYRGGAPIHKAIQMGEKITGVTVMNMAMKMDSGDILSQSSISINDLDDHDTLSEKLSVLGRELLLKTLPGIFAGTVQPIPQKLEEVTFAYNIKPEEEKLSFQRPVNEVYNHIRAFYSAPTTYCLLDDVPIKILVSKIHSLEQYPSSLPGEIIRADKKSCLVACNPGVLSIERLQLSGKSAMSIQDFMNGAGKDLLIPQKLLK